MNSLSVVFGTAIPTTFYMFVFYPYLCASFLHYSTLIEDVVFVSFSQMPLTDQ